MAKVSKESAKLHQVLLWYIEPEVVLLKKSQLEYIIAVGAAVSNDDASYAGASVTHKQLVEYQSGKFDLRFLMSHAGLRRYWKFELPTEGEDVALFRVTRGSDFIARSLPDSGFFSRSHADIDVAKQSLPDADEKFDIDGSWELGEFSNLYGQVEDVYYILNDLRRYKSPNTSAAQRGRISAAFQRPFRGGGSYVSFYDSIANDNLPMARLHVSGIQYNSPGFVKLKAKKEPFDSLIALLQAYAHEPTTTRRAYLALWKFLSFSGLLKASPDALISPVTTEEMERLAKALEGYLPGISYDSLKDMAGGNVLVASKVLMSIYRRVEKLFSFFEQGRVKYEGLDVDPLLDVDGE